MIARASADNITQRERYVIYGGEEDAVVDGVAWISWRRSGLVNQAASVLNRGAV